jgi:electron transfer flavoprotein alpha subunit
VSAGGTAPVVAVLDGTGPAAERQARALGGFLRHGLRRPAEEAVPVAAGEAAGVTLVFYADEGARERLVALAPTADVRLVRTPPHRHDLMTAALTAFQTGGGGELFVFPGGPLGTELATRLAARAGGGVATDVVDASISPHTLVCRRHVYSNHLTGRFELRRRPWCLSTDAAWQDSPLKPPAEHHVRADVEVPAGDLPVPAPLDDVELLEQPHTGDLEVARFLVVAGRGAGGPTGVKRIAAAAAGMGAAFGVTRPVAMNGWARLDRLVGVSGVRTSPAVCLTAGAHGAPAFLWGVERAGFIAAVDLDEDAPIAAEADAVVLGDAVDVVEALAEIVVAERAGR